MTMNFMVWLYLGLLTTPFYQAFPFVNNTLMNIFVHILCFVCRNILNVIPYSFGTERSELQKGEILHLLEILDLAYRKGTVVAIFKKPLSFSAVLFHSHPWLWNSVFRQEKGGRMGLLVVGKRGMRSTCDL